MEFEVLTKITMKMFVHNIVAPVIKPIFNWKNGPSIAWSTDILDASAIREKKFDPSLVGNKPDITVFVSSVGIKELLFVVEVKSPKHRRRNTDLVKLGNIIEDSLDKIIQDGFECSLYTPDLKYDAIYRFLLLGQFFLPEITQTLVFSLMLMTRASKKNTRGAHNSIRQKS